MLLTLEMFTCTFFNQSLYTHGVCCVCVNLTHTIHGYMKNVYTSLLFKVGRSAACIRSYNPLNSSYTIPSHILSSNPNYRLWIISALSRCSIPRVINPSAKCLKCLTKHQDNRSEEVLEGASADSDRSRQHVAWLRIALSSLLMMQSHLQTCMRTCTCC